MTPLSLQKTTPVGLDETSEGRRRKLDKAKGGGGGGGGGKRR